MSGFDRPRFLAAFTALVYVWLFAPILVVILFSFNSGRSLQVFSGFSLRWYETFLEDESLRESLVASLQIAAATTVIATVLGTAIAIGLARFSGRWSPDHRHPAAHPARDAGDRRRRVGLRALHPGGPGAVADHDHPRPHHVLDLLRGGRGAGAPRLDRDGARGGGAGPRRDAVAGRPARHAARLVAGHRGGGDARVRLLLRRLRALLLHHRRAAAAAARAHLLRAALRHLAHHQRHRHAHARRVGRRSSASPSRCRGCSGGGRAGWPSWPDRGARHERLGRRARRRVQAVRRVTRSCATSPCGSAAASSSPCSGRRAAGRRRRCG